MRTCRDASMNVQFVQCCKCTEPATGPHNTWQPSRRSQRSALVTSSSTTTHCFRSDSLPSRPLPSGNSPARKTSVFWRSSAKVKASLYDDRASLAFCCAAAAGWLLENYKGGKATVVACPHCVRKGGTLNLMHACAKMNEFLTTIQPGQQCPHPATVHASSCSVTSCLDCPHPCIDRPNSKPYL